MVANMLASAKESTLYTTAANVPLIPGPISTTGIPRNDRIDLRFLTKTSWSEQGHCWGPESVDLLLLKENVGDSTRAASCERTRSTALDVGKSKYGAELSGAGTKGHALLSDRIPDRGP